MSPNRSFDGSSGLSGLASPLNCQPNGPADVPMVNNNLTAVNGGWTLSLFSLSSQRANRHDVTHPIISPIICL